MAYVAMATWTPSVSVDVVTQEFSWIINGEVVKVMKLEPDVSSKSSADSALEIKEGDNVCFTVIAKDDFSESKPASACTDVPVVPPDAPTNPSIAIKWG